MPVDPSGSVSGAGACYGMYRKSCSCCWQVQWPPGPRSVETAQALADLPERRNPPSTVPPLRRDDVTARVEARQAAREEHERLHAQGVPRRH